MNRHLPVFLAAAMLIVSGAAANPAWDEADARAGVGEGPAAIDAAGGLPTQPAQAEPAIPRRGDPHTSPGPRARSETGRGASPAIHGGAGAPHPDIGAVGEILRQRLAEAADAGIVIFRVGGAEAQPAAAGAGSNGGLNEAASTRERAAAHGGSAPIVEPPATPRLPDLPPRFDQSAALVGEVGADFPDAPRGDAPSVLDAATAGDAVLARRSWLAREASTPGGSTANRPAIVGCLSDERLALPLVPATAGLAALQARRTALLGEFDRPDPSAVEAVARLYLAAGLGSEAAALVRDFVDDETLAGQLGELAALIEGDARGAPGALLARGCGGLHSVWRAYALALAGDADAAMAEIGANMVAIEGVPYALRGRIAIELALSALDAGDADRAAWLRTMASRGDQSDPAAAWRLRLVEARQNLSEGRTRIGIAGLSELVLAGAEAGERAALALAELGPGLALVETEVLQVAADLLGARALIEGGTTAGASALRAEALIVASLAGQGQAISVLSHALARGLLDGDAYVAGIAALAAPAGTEIGGRQLALLHDEAPAQFRDALAHAGFRRALALSYAGIGTPLLARRVLEPDDLADDSFREAFVHASLSFADDELAAWLGVEDAASTATMPGEAPPGPPGTDVGADPALRDENGPRDTAALRPNADLARQALAAIASASSDIERIRRILDDG